MSSKVQVTVISALVLAIVGAAAAYFALAGSAQASNGVIMSSSNVYRFADASQVEGATSTLSRTEYGISATVQTSDLEEGNAYTLWWVIFNHPENCVAPIPGLSNCGEDDVFGEPFGETPVEVSVQYAGGNIVGGTGHADFGAYLVEGEIPVGAGQLVFGPGLYDAEKAEVHLVVRDHGPVMPLMEQAQLSTFGGACTAETEPTGVGPLGDNDCADLQFAIHMPPQGN